MDGAVPRAWALAFEAPVGYDRAVRFMEAVHAARVGGTVPDVILLMQHTPVVTLGRRGRDGHLRLSADELAARGIELRRASRGGDVTYHGPGQWVLYPIIRLGIGTADAHGYLWLLEEIAIRSAEAFGVVAFRRRGLSGAWTTAGKIAAIGFFLRHWVTLHGMSFNATLDLSGFETIVPCGLVGERVASLAAILGPAAPPADAVGRVLLERAVHILRRDARFFRAPEEIPVELRRLWEQTAAEAPTPTSDPAVAPAPRKP
jgi:lipoate-protein ligase B